MAIGTPTSVSTYDPGFGSGAGAFVLTIPVGGVPQAAVVFLSGVSDSDTANFSAVSDSRGNTWTVDRQQHSAGGNNSVVLASAVVATALVSGDTVTIDLTVAGCHAGFFIFYATATGATWTAPVLDQTTSANSAFGATYASGATSTTTQAEELWVGVASGGDATTSTPTGPWVELLDSGAVFITNSRQIIVNYQITSATGTANNQGTWSVNDGGQIIVATYKDTVAAAAGAAPTQPLLAPGLRGPG